MKSTLSNREVKAIIFVTVWTSARITITPRLSSRRNNGGLDGKEGLDVKSSRKISFIKDSGAVEVIVVRDPFMTEIDYDQAKFFRDYQHPERQDVRGRGKIIKKELSMVDQETKKVKKDKVQKKEEVTQSKDSPPVVPKGKRAIWHDGYRYTNAKNTEIVIRGHWELIDEKLKVEKKATKIELAAEGK